jgi:RNA polymerase sigma-70 factor (ECF subfamily)
MLDPAIWLQRHGDYLYRHALFRLRDAAAAEDVVQETLLAALKSSNRFVGRSNERTWLVGILKHKIIDHYRSSQREAQLEGCDNDDEFFDKAGAWRSTSRPVAWNVNPESALELKDFQRSLEWCLNQLPERLAQVFVLREIDELTTEEICSLLSITPTNLWVMLHRARLRLQGLLGARLLKGVAPAISGSECLQPVG